MTVQIFLREVLSVNETIVSRIGPVKICFIVQFYDGKIFI